MEEKLYSQEDVFAVISGEILKLTCNTGHVRKR